MTLAGSLFLPNGTATTSLQSSLTGTSTVQGFLSVLGTNSTSTFSGGVSVQSFNVAGSATSTFASGLNLAAGCFSVNGVCLATNFATSSADYYVNASSTIPKTYTSNSFTAIQTFINASTTNISASYASSTQGFFGSVVVGTLSGFLKATAGVVANSLVSLTADISGILGVANGGTGWAKLAANTILTGNDSGAVSTTTVNGGLLLSGGSLTLNVANANIWTGLQSFGNASTSLQSVFTKAYFGATATTTIDSAGNVAVAGTLNVTGNTTLSNATTTNLLVTASSSILNLSGVNSTTTNATTTNFFATTARAGTLVSNGAVNFSTTLSVTGLTTLGSASSTLLSVANGTATTTVQAQATSTFGAGVQTSALSIGSLGGFLKAVSGFVTTSLVSLTSDVSGILGVANGGTGWANLAANTLLTGNGSGAVATTSITGGGLLLSPGSLSLNVANANVWTGLQTFGNASTTLFESMTQFARTIQSTSTNALVFKTNFTSSAGLTLGGTSTPQMAALDTLNNRVTIGTGGGTPTLFVVDTKNTLGDPAGVDGAQYYNSNTAQYRCFANGSWRTCGGQAASSTGDVQFKNTDGSFTATANFNWNLASNGLTITGNPGQISNLLTIASSTGITMFSVSSAGVLTLATTTDPSTPSIGQIALYAKTIANRSLPATEDSNGQITTIQPFMARNKIGYWNPPGNSTTVPGVFGFPLFSTAGTVTARAVAATNIATRLRRLGYVSSAVAGNFAEARFAVAQYTVGDGAGLGGFDLITRFVPSDTAAVAGERFFIGMTSVTVAATNVEPSTQTNVIGLAQISTSNNLQIVYGGSVAQTPIDLGAGFPANTLSTDAYEFALFSSTNSSTTVGYTVTRLGTGATVSGVLSGAAGVAIPATTTLMTFKTWKTNNATGAAVGFDLGSVYIETDN